MSTKTNLEAEIRDLAARRDITAAAQRYVRGLDRLDIELIRSAFHEGAYIDVGLMKGRRDEYVDFCAAFLGDAVSSFHQLGQIDIEIDGEKASGEIYFYSHHRVITDGEAQDLIIAGRYIDEYGLSNDEWRITRRCLLVDWSRTTPAADGYFTIAPDVLRGARGGEDFSQRRNWPADGADS